MSDTPDLPDEDEGTTILQAWLIGEGTLHCSIAPVSADPEFWSQILADLARNIAGMIADESKTDPEARLMRKGDGQPAKLSFMGHALVENRHGLLVDLHVSTATGYAERETALEMLDEHVPRERATLGADRAYDTRDFVDDCRERGVTPHVAQNDTRRRSAIDQRTTRHVGYSISQRIRMRIEQVFGWGKTIGGLKRTRVRGLARTRFGTYLVGAAYNLLRITNLRRQLAT